MSSDAIFCKGPSPLIHSTPWPLKRCGQMAKGHGCALLIDFLIRPAGRSRNRCRVNTVKLALIGGEEFAPGFEDVHSALLSPLRAGQSRGVFLPTCAAHDGLEVVKYWA